MQSGLSEIWITVAKLTGHAQYPSRRPNKGYTFTWRTKESLDTRKEAFRVSVSKWTSKYVIHVRYDTIRFDLTILLDPILFLPRPPIYFSRSVRVANYVPVSVIVSGVSYRIVSYRIVSYRIVSYWTEDSVEKTTIRKVLGNGKTYISLSRYLSFTDQRLFRCFLLSDIFRSRIK